MGFIISWQQAKVLVQLADILTASTMDDKIYKIRWGQIYDVTGADHQQDAACWQ